MNRFDLQDSTTFKKTDFSEVVSFIKRTFNSYDKTIPLHEPKFLGNERKYLLDAIDSTFVSSVGKYVDLFEEMIQRLTGTKYAVATVNGTEALHVSLILAGVQRDDEVITQPITFVATANAITYTGAHPVFVDVDLDTIGLSPVALEEFLKHNTEIVNGNSINKKTGRRIAACLPMHTFGFPLRIEEIVDICKKRNIPVVEDAAESLGSYYNNRHTGTFGLLGAFSFNGNKTVTSGGGGCIVTNNEQLFKKAKHITTTAKVPHKWEYVHDMTGYNFRMPNLNAALACAQLEQLSGFIEKKRRLAEKYAEFFSQLSIFFVRELPGTRANYWLNTIILSDKKERDAFLEFSNENKVMSRPAWQLMNGLIMYRNCEVINIKNSEWLVDRIVNIPSSVITGL